jgi:hypothetical protein
MGWGVQLRGKDHARFAEVIFTALVRAPFDAEIATHIKVRLAGDAIAHNIDAIKHGGRHFWFVIPLDDELYA